MKTLWTFFAVLFLSGFVSSPSFALALAAEKADVKTFGKMEPQTATATTLTEVTGNYDKFKGKNVSLNGTVKKVFEMNTSHLPFVVKPAEFVDILTSIK